jgi:outer membrane biosynthesis protein TonB
MSHLRLDDLLARDVAVEWFEGVAVLQVTCRALRAQGGSGSGFPSAADILVGPGGSIAISGQPSGNGVQVAAHLLARMLSEDVPVRLRLALSQATARESAYASLIEFSEALAYFERPDPEAVVDALRQRALLAQPRIDAPAADEERLTSRTAVAPRRSHRLALVAVAVSAVACASVWLLGGARVSLSASREKVEARSPSPADTATRAHLGRRPPSASTPADASVPGTPEIGVEATAVVATTGRESAPDPQVRDELPSVSYLEPSVLVDAVAPRLMLAELSAPAPTTTASDSLAEDSNRIYSRAESDVTPPLNVYPKFPTQSPSSDVKSRTVLELTIAKDGVVEHVKMLTIPRNIHEFMLLSAAKAWRFEPARIGGRAVRFRHTVALDARSAAGGDPR